MRMMKHIHVTGVVQGVGFRPFVYGLATRLDLHGWVCNTSAGVDIVIQGDDDRVRTFVESLSTEAPPLARIEQVSAWDEPGEEYPDFEIKESEKVDGAFQPVSPDVALCADCERELFDPNDRRYLYPFINCTNCGPRFTIIMDLPYDRPATTMADFPMCDQCRREYEDPTDRRFHAQPVACPDCGPFVQFWESAEHPSSITRIDLRLSAILGARKLLREGRVAAIKGLGGFHLACDATNEKAVAELRRRKGRAGKPFAVMFADLNTVNQFCILGKDEMTLLNGYEKPIVLLNRRTGTKIAPSVAPQMDTLGVMLPYTPLHHLLVNQSDPILRREPAPPVLVMTSGNFSEEPIATENQDALERLGPLADAFLLHNRDIHIRCDDSVVRVDHKQNGRNNEGQQPEIIHLRRSRAYAPYPVSLPFDSVPSLAVGGELKNTFCLTRDRYAFLSHHIGDMENAEVYESFEQGVEHLNRLFRVKPELIAHDMHPGYFTTQYAERITDIPRVPVQHHHAHIAACMTDNGLTDRKVIGLSFDGTGYGTDGKIWGGEVLLASYADFERFAHLEYLPLPGGDSAIRHPWRIAVGYAHALGIEIDDLPFLQNIDKQAIKIVRQQVEKRLNAPLTSSMGRLFDAVASLIGIRSDVTYEAQAAIELEALSKPFLLTANAHSYSIEETQNGINIRLGDLLNAVVQDVRKNRPAGMIGARFHKTIVEMSIDICERARRRSNLNEVALSGGVWQNLILLNLVRDGLENEGFEVYFHKQVPTNDGGLALGQAAIANYQIKNGGLHVP